ncbi:hypothetical protein [Dietzia sp. MNB45]|uniref:hypothetical protein n=1 Tax=Dietzia sp. MNB45 TaxID=3238800 RepID=UPI003F8197C3
MNEVNRATISSPYSIADAAGGAAQLDPIDMTGKQFPNCTPGIYRFTEKLANGAHLESLLHRKHADSLVVVFHGATDRTRYKMPRFEWFNTLTSNDLDASVLYVSDPVLSIDERIQLAWYVGWKDIDVHEIIANRIDEARRTFGAKRLIIAGSSGGGFASLMVSSLLPDSICIPMNAQTSIPGYFVNGTGLGPQRFFAERVMPHLVPNGLKDSEIPSWAEPMLDRLSAVQRYSRRMENRVVYVQNVNDFHLEQHFLPFLHSTVNAGNGAELSTVFYSGPTAHVVPSAEIFATQIIDALG